MYNVLFRDCVLGKAETKANAITIAWNYAKEINMEYEEETKHYGRIDLKFHRNIFPYDTEYITIIKE